MRFVIYFNPTPSSTSPCPLLLHQVPYLSYFCPYTNFCIDIYIYIYISVCVCLSHTPSCKADLQPPSQVLIIHVLRKNLIVRLFLAFSIILLTISACDKFCKHISQVTSLILETQVPSDGNLMWIKKFTWNSTLRDLSSLKDLQLLICCCFRLVMMLPSEFVLVRHQN